MATSGMYYEAANNNRMQQQDAPVYQNVSPTRQPHLEQQKKVITQMGRIEIDELKDSLRYAEYLLSRTLQEKEQLMKQNGEHSFQMQQVAQQLQKAQSSQKQAETAVNQMEGKFNYLNHQQQAAQGQSQEKLVQLQREINFRENEIEKYRSQIVQREQTLSQAVVSDHLNKVSKDNLQDQLKNRNYQVNQLTEQLNSTKKQLDEVVMTRKAEGTAQLQLEHFKTENARLIQMLSKTEEFKNFGTLAQDSGLAVRHMDMERLPDTYQFKVKKDTLKDFKEGDELEDWIPEEAFKVAHDFRNKCASQVKQSLMNQLLGDLNKIWREREKKQIQRIKSDANSEVEYLRRQLNYQKPYDQVMHEADIKRLKGEVKSAQQSLRENVAVIKQDKKGPNHGLKLVDQTVKYTNQIQIERRQLQEENDKLKLKLEQLEKRIRDGDGERSKFYEGASWAAKNSVLKCDQGVQKASQIKDEYEQRMKSCGNDDFLRLRNADWVIDTTQRLVKEIRNDNQELLEQSIRNHVQTH